MFLLKFCVFMLFLWFDKVFVLRMFFAFFFCLFFLFWCRNIQSTALAKPKSVMEQAKRRETFKTIYISLLGRNYYMSSATAKKSLASLRSLLSPASSQHPSASASLSHPSLLVSCFIDDKKWRPPQLYGGDRFLAHLHFARDDGLNGKREKRIHFSKFSLFSLFSLPNIIRQSPSRPSISSSIIFIVCYSLYTSICAIQVTLYTCTAFDIACFGDSIACVFGDFSNTAFFKCRFYLWEHLFAVRNLWVIPVNDVFYEDIPRSVPTSYIRDVFIAPALLSCCFLERNELPSRLALASTL